MGQNLFASNVLQALLSWLQSLFSGLWSIVSGANGGSMLKWLSGNWLSLLVFFLVLGIAADIIVYLFRWRPYWWWFGKKRLIIDDELLDEDEYYAPPRKSAPAVKAPVRRPVRGAASSPARYGQARVNAPAPKAPPAPRRVHTYGLRGNDASSARIGGAVTRDSIFDLPPVSASREDVDALYIAPPRDNSAASGRNAR